MILVITGGTGSLGKAIISHQDILKKNKITKIRVLSRDEVKQADLLANYDGDIQLDCYLADVSDGPRMQFGLKDAHYVIHAAAQKRIEKFALDVPQGYKTNITGTHNVSDAFLNSKNAISGVLVSTDKAAEPTTAYGVSKLAAEHLWLWNNTHQSKVAFGVTRYGNIFGSRGSVIELWSKLAKKQKKLPITDPACTRYFMEIQDAAKFVLGALFKKSKTLNIPEMKSADMIQIANMIYDFYNPMKKTRFDFIGMRGIEKLHEVLDSSGGSSLNANRFSDMELRQMFQRYLEDHC